MDRVLEDQMGSKGNVVGGCGSAGAGTGFARVPGTAILGVVTLTALRYAQVVPTLGKAWSGDGDSQNGDINMSESTGSPEYLFQKKEMVHF